MRVVIEPEISNHDPALYNSGEVAEKVPGFHAVDEKSLQAYNEQGFLVVSQGYTKDQIQEARETLRQMTLADDPHCCDVYYEGRIRDLLKNARREHVEEDGDFSFEALALGDISEHLPSLSSEIRAKYVRKFAGFTESHAALQRIASHPGLIQAVEKLAGDKVRLFQDMAMIKPPGGREKPWHQDHAYFNLPLDARIVGVWLALDRVTPDNGCMYVLAGAHKTGPRIHFMRRDWQICDTEMNGCKSTCVPMEAGDVLLFDAKLPHGTPTNRSEDYRWAIQLHYVPQGLQGVDEQVRLNAFGNEGKNVTC